MGSADGLKKECEIMGYAVYHMEKGKSNTGGIGNHIDRKKGHEHSYQHADKERMHLNKVYKVHKDRQNLPLSSAINDRIEEGYKGKKAIRKDAVKFITHILTGSHEEMKEIFADKKKAEEWIKANYNFISSEFGAENIVRFTLHMDEKTPHIHAVTVPLTEDGRLSASDIIGNRKVMQERQDRYASAMQNFDLERGIRSTGIKHETAREYYTRIEEAQKSQNEPDIKASKNVLGVYTAKSVEEVEEALKSYKMALNDVSEKLDRERVKVQSLAKGSERLEKEKAILKRENNRIENTLEHYKQNPEQLVEAKEKRLQQQKARIELEKKQKAERDFPKAIKLAVNNALIKNQETQENFTMENIISEFDMILKYNNQPNIWKSEQIENAIADEVKRRIEQSQNQEQEQEQGNKRKFRR